MVWEEKQLDLPQAQQENIREISKQNNYWKLTNSITGKVDLADIHRKSFRIISDPKLLLFAFCIVANVLNVGLLWKNTYLCFVIASGLLFLIWSQDYSEYGIKKWPFLITSIIVAVGGPFLENIMIYLSHDKCWVYGNPFKPLKVSLDLIPGYGIMGAATVLSYKLLEKFFKKTS